MADEHSIFFRVNADDEEAQKKLDDLQKEIEKTAKTLDKTNAKHNGLVDALEAAKTTAKETAAEIEKTQAEIYATTNDINNKRFPGSGAMIPPDAYADLIAQKDALLEKQRELQARLAEENKTVEKIQKEEQKVAATLKEQTDSLAKQKSEADEVERVLAKESARTLPQLKSAMEEANTSIRSGFTSILKWGFGIRTAFALVRRLKSYVKDAVLAFAEQDTETRNNINNLKASLNTLKLSWGAAFAPILNLVTPILQRLIQWLTNAANAVAKFFAILTGKTSYKKAVAANTALADSYTEAGNAAEEAEGQLMGFDEINKLNAENSVKNAGGIGGSAQAGSGLVDEEIGQFDKMKQHMAELELLAWGVGAALAAWKLGPVAGEIVMLIGGIKMLIDGMKEWISTGEVTSQTLWKIDGGLGLIGIALSLLTGSWIPLAVAGIAGLMFSLPEILGGLSEFFHGIGMDGIGNFLAGMAEKAAGAREWVRTNVFAPIQTWFDEGIEELKTQEHKGEYSDALSWFVCGVLGMPTNEEWADYGKSAIQYFVDGFDGFLDEIHNVIGGPLEDLIEVEIPETIEWFKEMGPSVIKWLVEGFWDFTGELHNIIGGPIEDMVEGIKRTGEGLLTSVHDLIERIKQAIKLPHLSVSWTDYGWFSWPNVSVSWYAKGGIFDRASLIGVGENGKEAVLPLEHNTGWIKDLAGQILGQMNSLLPPMPAMAMGQVVPPNAQRGGGISEADIAKILAAIQGVTGSVGGSGQHVAILEVNGREFARAIYDDQKAVATEHGMSLIVNG